VQSAAGLAADLRRYSLSAMAIGNGCAPAGMHRSDFTTGSLTLPLTRRNNMIELKSIRMW